MDKFVGQYVIVRCSDAGVHAGVLESCTESGVATLTNARRLWYWVCAKGHSLSGVALHGITDQSKIAGQIESMQVLGVCEIIPCTPESETSIRNAEEHNA